MGREDARTRMRMTGPTRTTRVGMQGLGLALLPLLAACGSGGDRVADSAAAAGTTANATSGTMPADSMGMGAPDPNAAPKPADAEMQAVLDQHATLGAKPLETLTPAEARQDPSPADAVKALLVAQGKDTTPTVLVPGVTSVDRTIPGGAGQAMPTRIYTPDGAGPFPVVVYYHGGGWVIANKDVYDGGARGLVEAGERGRRLGRLPARAGEQVPRAARRRAGRVQVGARERGAPSRAIRRRIALAGESAGGNLAVATAIAARDANLQKPLAVLSVYPIAQPDTTTPSYTQYAKAKPLNRAGMGWFAKHVSRTPADLQDPRINLVKAEPRRPAAGDDHQRGDRSAA